MFHLNDSHQQLMVHWAGEGSDVIMCLARDSSRSSLVRPSAVYISYDYGTTFVNKTESFKLGEGSSHYAHLDKFYIHPKYNSHVSTVLCNLIYFKFEVGKIKMEVSYLLLSSSKESSGLVKTLRNYDTQ